VFERVAEALVVDTDRLSQGRAGERDAGIGERGTYALVERGRRRSR